MFDTLVIELPRESSREIRTLLKENNVEFLGLALLSNGMPEMITLVKSLSDLKIWGAVSTVISAWLVNKASRRVKIYMEDGKVKEMDFRGFNAKDIAEIREGFTQISMYESKETSTKESEDIAD